eukprot:CAMPEP_0170792954 /NCGR_PEP_ID=MMETSP0733-20121128/22304_1 /TAXON_ID=186038 /ORGANISM="Fragilariopsis kerguelensis, Strain L26-C5" /LENGTH=124 /DNA_ID=CAMNT_0011141687 /DNA_START=143 /DNA_END=518 /DNA_ORIENTATION=-
MANKRARKDSSHRTNDSSFESRISAIDENTIQEMRRLDEMVVDETIFYCSRSKSPSTGTGTGTGIHGAFNRKNVDAHLDYDRSTEHPIVCQIGGMDPELTAFTSRIVTEEYGYDEINLNMGMND